MPKKYGQKIAHDILRVRLSQVILNEEYKAGRFKIPVHLAMGHEAIAVAVSRVMGKNDKLILSHRNVAYNLARVSTLKPELDEYLLLKSGLAQGSLGSMNLANPAKQIPYTSSILGNNFSVATGIAFAQKILSHNGLTVVLGGDGSIEEGSFYESLVLLKTLGAAAFVIVENNGWSLSTHIKERRCPIDLEPLTKSIGVAYRKMKGNDAYRYIEELKKLRDFSLRHHEPVCIEVEVATLGDKRAPKTPEHPEGRFINYHAGPADVIILTDWPLLREDAADPVFALSKHFKKSELQKMSREILATLKKELSIS